jgi:hypothetical protein
MSTDTTFLKYIHGCCPSPNVELNAENVSIVCRAVCVAVVVTKGESLAFIKICPY